MKTVGSFGTPNIAGLTAGVRAVDEMRSQANRDAVEALRKLGSSALNTMYKKELTDHLQKLQQEGAQSAVKQWGVRDTIEAEYQSLISEGVPQDIAEGHRKTRITEWEQSLDDPAVANEGTIGGFLHQENVYRDAYNKTMSHNLSIRTMEDIARNEDAKNYTPEQFGQYVSSIMERDSANLGDDLKSIYGLTMMRNYPSIMENYEKSRMENLISKDRAAKGTAIVNSFKTGDAGDQRDVLTYLLSPDNVNSPVYFGSAIRQALLANDPITAQTMAEAVFTDERYTPEQRMKMKEAYDTNFTWVAEHTNWYDTAKADRYAMLKKISMVARTKEEAVEMAMEQQKAAHAAGMGNLAIGLEEAYKAHDAGASAREKTLGVSTEAGYGPALLTMLEQGKLSPTAVRQVDNSWGLSKEKQQDLLSTGLTEFSQSCIAQAKDALASGDEEKAMQALYPVAKMISNVMGDEGTDQSMKKVMLNTFVDNFGLARLGRKPGETIGPLYGADLKLAYMLTSSLSDGLDSLRVSAVSVPFASAMNTVARINSEMSNGKSLESAQDIVSQDTPNMRLDPRYLSDGETEIDKTVAGENSSKFLSDMFAVDFSPEEAKLASAVVSQIAKDRFRSTNLTPEEAIEQAVSYVRDYSLGIDTVTGQYITKNQPTLRTRNADIKYAKAMAVVKAFPDVSIKAGKANESYQYLYNMTTKDWDNVVNDMAKNAVADKYMKAGSSRLASQIRAGDYRIRSYNVGVENRDGELTQVYTMQFEAPDGSYMPFTFTNEEVADKALKDYLARLPTSKFPVGDY